VDEFRPKHLQAFAQFFDQVLEVFLYGGTFVKPVTDVDIHERLGVPDEVAQVLPKENCTPGKKFASGEFRSQKRIEPIWELGAAGRPGVAGV
jgi:hypothetical protein